VAPLDFLFLLKPPVLLLFLMEVPAGEADGNRNPVRA
jgi:hypothetical protein